jgi:hypothetical protein
VSEGGRFRRPGLHETALLLLGAGTLLALAVRAGPADRMTCEAAVVTLGFAAVVFLLTGEGPSAQKIRFGMAYGYILWFYLSVQRITPALHTPLRDDGLRAADEFLFGCLPAVAVQGYSAGWLTDLLSACYAGYLIYLHVVLVHALWRPTCEMLHLGARLFTTYAVGLAGYLLVPAVGPGQAFPELFTTPLSGGILTHLNAALVARGSSRFDVFPSLHVLITCVLLAHDRRYVPRRFRLMLLPAAGMVAATLYLRYHYAVDLLAGFALFVAVRWTTARYLNRSNSRIPRCPPDVVAGTLQP